MPQAPRARARSATRYTEARFEVIDLTKDDDGPEKASPASSGAGPADTAKEDNDRPVPPRAQKRKDRSPGPDSKAGDTPARKLLPQKKQKTASQGFKDKTAAKAVGLPPTSPVSTPSASPPSSSLAKGSPEAIHATYVEARKAWYQTQPPLAQTDEQYRKVNGLPLRYSEASYRYCRDWKRMTPLRTTSTGSRGWTEEEMRAYLDWDRAEDARV